MDTQIPASADMKSGEHAPILRPAQVERLFADGLNEITARICGWAFPVTIVGVLGRYSDRAPKSPRYYQVPIEDIADGSTIQMDIDKAVMDGSGIESGDQVRVVGRIGANLFRGEISLRVNALAIAFDGDLSVDRRRQERPVLDLLRRLPRNRHAFPEQPDPTLTLIHSAASEARVADDFLTALQDRVSAARRVMVPVAMNDPARIASAIREAGTAIVAVVRGGGAASDFLVFDHPDVLEALAHCRGHRVLGLGHSADTTLAELVVDHAAITPSAAGQYVGDYIMKIRAARFREQREAEQRRMDSMASSGSGSSGSAGLALPDWLKEHTTLKLLGLGVLLGLVLARLL
ncbi:exodeoxyribonuclease VII large subunit [Gluconacetobacter sacchari]|uniref:Exodeoxyribonuclease VII large subunit n=2 Tax=Gluconacetobacter sacchari TaxID=92759 RepID=A0A7W4IFH8_9PROT|nr:exodeoxyribonuclease VII large subunit [Gluconacetobacter sacchari]MBB2161824.1 exodeoxyribonuclease VII large subunit [Gluconacetobacter sacchari]